jgi:polyisoprenoid-binding protein YceI
MRFFFAAAALTLAACSQTAPEAPSGPPAPVAIDAPTGAYTLDPTHTSVIVRANHFGLSNYTLRLTGVAGTLNFDAANPTQSSVNVTMAADSVQTEYVGARDFDDELENSEWLDAANHPQITFVSTGVELTGPNTGRMTGDLTLRGQTHPITLDVTYNAGYRQHPMGFPMALLGFSARGTFKRSDYGMNVLLPANTGGVGVSDDVAIEIEAEFTQPAAPANPTN